MPNQGVSVAKTCGGFIGFQDLFTISRETRDMVDANQHTRGRFLCDVARVAAQ